MHWLDATVWLALGGFWFALFLHFLKRLPLVPRELWRKQKMAEPTRSAPDTKRATSACAWSTWFALGLVLAALVIFPVVVGLYRLFERQHPSPDAPSRIALHPRMIAPPPQLQANPAIDLAQYRSRAGREAQQLRLGRQSAGIIHIPIERAMDLIAQRGLPTRGPGTQNASGITPVQMQTQKARPSHEEAMNRGRAVILSGAKRSRRISRTVWRETRRGARSFVSISLRSIPLRMTCW